MTICNWDDVLKAILFRARWHYVRFESFEEEIGVLQGLVEPSDRDKKKNQRKIKLAIEELDHLFYWQRVYDDVHAFLCRPLCDLNDMDISGCRIFYDTYQMID